MGNLIDIPPTECFLMIAQAGAAELVKQYVNSTGINLLTWEVLPPLLAAGRTRDGCGQPFEPPPGAGIGVVIEVCPNEVERLYHEQCRPSDAWWHRSVQPPEDESGEQLSMEDLFD